jgi:tetratricopeptide (TPR) repeat protein
MGKLIHLLLILLVFSVPLIFSNATTEVYGLIKAVTIELFALSILIFWLIQYVISPKPGSRIQDQGSRTGQLLLFFFIFACISLIRAINVYAGLGSLYLLTAYLILFFVILSNTKSLSGVRQIVTSAILAGAGACAWSIYQNRGLNFAAGRFAYSSTFGNPIFFSQYLTAMIPLSLSMLLSEAKPHSNILRGGLYLLAAMVMSVLLIYIRSIGAYLALIVALLYCYIVILLYCSKRVRKILLSLSVICLIALTILGVIFWPKLQANIRGRQLQNLMRIHVWSGSLNMIKGHPLWGVGLGNFEYAYPLYRTMEEKTTTPKGVKYTRAHNQFLQAWSETGVFGLLAFLGLIIYAFGKSRHLIKEKTGEGNFSEVYLIAGITASLIALLVQSLFNPMLEIPTSGLTFWVLLGLLFSIERQEATGPRVLAGGRLLRKRLAAGTLGLVLLGAGPPVIIRPLIADYFLKKANLAEAEKETRQAASYLERALKAYPHNWEAQFKLGRINQRIGAYKEAIGHYGDALRYHPNYPVIWNNLGTAYIQADRTNQAIKAFTRAVEIDNLYVGAYYNLVLAYRKAGQFDKAREQMEQVRFVHPTFLGNMYLESGLFDEAALELHNAIKNHPDNIEAHFKLARTWQMQGKIKQAIDMYKRTVQLDQMHVEAYLALAQLYEQKGDLDAALSAYESALQAVPFKANDIWEDISFYSDLGIYHQVLEGHKKLEELQDARLKIYKQLAAIYQRRGQAKRAIENYEELSKLAPQDKAVLEELAGLYEKEGLYDKAKDAYAKIMETEVSRKEILKEKILRLNKIAANNALAEIYKNQGLLQKAIEQYREILKSDPENIHSLRLLGDTFVQTAQYSQAEDAYKQAIRLAPGNIDARLALGQLYLQRGRLKDAERIYKEAVEIAPYDPRGALALGRFYRQQARVDEAEKIYRQAINLSPNDLELHLALATLLEEKGKTQEAISEYREVLRIEPDNKEAKLRLNALQ